MKKQIKTGILLMIISMLLCVTCMAEESTVSSIVAENTVNDDTPRIGIISAMSNEISLLLDNAQIEYVKKIGNEDYHVGKLCGREVVITKSGIGKALSASGATAMLNNFNITEAQNELGKCYYNGTGVEQNYEEALKYFQMAADQGYAKSQNNLDAGYEPDETDKEHMKEVLGEDYSTRDETKDNEAA